MEGAEKLKLNRLWKGSNVEAGLAEKAEQVKEVIKIGSFNHADTDFSHHYDFVPPTLILN